MLKFLHFFKPHLIVLNEQLLTINGIDLSTRLQVMKELQTIPLLVFRANMQSTMSENHQVTVIKQPPEWSNLLETIKTVLA